MTLTSDKQIPNPARNRVGLELMIRVRQMYLRGQLTDNIPTDTSITKLIHNKIPCLVDKGVIVNV